MGECAYYLKAEFPTETIAKAMAKKMNKFFMESIGAYSFWQKDRDSNQDTFWKDFEKKFPLMSEYVKDAGLWGKDPNDLSGNIDFGQDEHNENLVRGTTVGWGGADVWHLSDWSPVCDFIKKKYGAVKVVWDTEENGCGSLDALQLYDWEKIVRDILEHKELHPLLIRINNDFDELLDRTIRQSNDIKPKRGTK
jgi:hypothetical protein